MTDSAPAWLFSFVDLAFLLIIAMTQLGVEANGISLELGDIIIPRIDSEATRQLPGGSAQRLQLRVYPLTDSAKQPFELAVPGADPQAPEARHGITGLRERLTTLHAEGAPKPMLAPHEDSRSQDMLDAVGMLENFWPGGRRATVGRLLVHR